MGLPGLTTSQMIEVDRIMMDDLGIPLELMMEQAGLNMARLAISLSNSDNQTFRIIAGTGSNGGGGMVTARRLQNWGYETEIVLPRKKSMLRKIPALQLTRAISTGAKVANELPRHSSSYTVIDAYLGYGFKPRKDETSESVYEYLRSEPSVVCLDVPSGLDSTSGISYSQLKPVATMTIAFLKRGLLTSSRDLTGDLYVADIGVPQFVYQSNLDLSWNEPYSISDLRSLYSAFAQDSLQKVEVSKSDDLTKWTVCANDKR